MGNANNSDQSLIKGQGYRILAVRSHSPFQGQVEPFFDFITAVEVQEKENQGQRDKSAAQTLDKLSGERSQIKQKSFVQVLNGCQDRLVKVKIVSTKYRNVRTIDVIPNDKWNGSNDLVGITLRKERYDEAFDNYFPISDILQNSPIKKAGIREGEFLIGCLEYHYRSINHFTQGLYERFFDKELNNKSIHLAVYDILTDELSLKQVVLSRGWGGKGLLGCQFLQGMLNKFPNNFEEQRKALTVKEEARRKNLILKNQLGDCDGVSKSMMESLKNKKNKHYRNIRNLLALEPPSAQNWPHPKRQENVHHNKIAQQEQQRTEKRFGLESSKEKRIGDLEKRVVSLEKALQSVKEYLRKLQISEQAESHN